jgi:hypothetical protein
MSQKPKATSVPVQTEIPPQAYQHVEGKKLVNPPSTAPEEPEKRDDKTTADLFLHSVKVYFDVRDGSYLTQLNGRYIAMKKNDLAMRLRAMGLRDDLYVKTKDRGSLREIDFPFYMAQNDRMIDFAGALAGRRVGLFTDSVGKKYLVTEEAAGIWEPLIKKASPVFFPEFARELLGDEQSRYFFYWLARSVKALRDGDFNAGQCLIFAGPPRCGKSLLQLFITEILGGRSANPFNYLMGENFNKDLQAAEHWMVEDPGTSTDIRTRRLFGEKIKEATVNRDIRINGKGKDAAKFPIFRRNTISVNSESEAIAVCPPMVEGVKDKIMLFMCEPVSKAFDRFRDKYGVFVQKTVWDFFMTELHAVRSWLLDTFKRVPSALVDERMGIVAYHNPPILAQLASMTYESRFLELLDQKYFPSNEKDEVFTKVEQLAADFQKDLLEHNRYEAEKIFRTPGQCGSHFAKLEKSRPDRVDSRLLNGNQLWIVLPPAKLK